MNTRTPPANGTAAVAVVGAGIAGIATAYSLVVDHGIADVVLVDAGQSMGFTSARSGDNYRNWWPHPVMAAFTNRSIDLMERIARRTGNRIDMTRRGYAVATREPDIDELVEQLNLGYGDASGRFMRVHDRASARTYRPPRSGVWEDAPDGVDILHGERLVREIFPSFDPDVRTVIHVRRAGDIDGYQLGAYMLEAFRDTGGKRVTGTVAGIEHRGRYILDIRANDATTKTEAGKIVNAAGPFAADIAGMLGVDLPVHNTLQQKLACEDTARAIPRDLPFSIDLDRQRIGWTDDEREMLREDPELARFAREMPGAVHCRPDGGDRGTRVKLGWAFNERTAAPTWNPPLDAHFPDIVLRGASRLHPALARYAGHVPRRPPSLRGLVHDDRGELAADRADGSGRRLHELRALGLRDDGRLRRRRAVRGVGRRSAAARVCEGVLAAAPRGRGADDAALEDESGRALRAGGPTVLAAIRDADLDRIMVTFDFRRRTASDFGKSVRSSTPGRAISPTRLFTRGGYTPKWFGLRLPTALSTGRLDMNFFVKAVWDEETKVFHSDSDIVGLHIEAETLEEFREIMVDIAPELVLANHVTNDDLLTKPLRELVPVIWSGTDGEQLLQTSR